jgi:hypothetical protein
LDQKESVKRGGEVLTVMASPMGRLLYEPVGSGKAQADEKDVKVDIDSLVKRDK